MARRRKAAAKAVHGSTTTRDTVRALQNILGSLGPLSTFTKMSVGRLKAIAEGTNKKPLTASEVQRIARLSREAPRFFEKGSYGFHKVKGMSRDLTYQQLTALSKREFVPLGPITLEEIAHFFQVDLNWVYKVSQTRGIESGVMEAGGVVSAYGDDGARYVAYVVTNQQTQESRFFWGRWDAVAEVAVMDFRDHYQLADEDGYDVIIGYLEGVQS